MLIIRLSVVIGITYRASFINIVEDSTYLDHTLMAWYSEQSVLIKAELRQTLINFVVGGTILSIIID